MRPFRALRGIAYHRPPFRRLPRTARHAHTSCTREPRERLPNTNNVRAYDGDAVAPIEERIATCQHGRYMTRKPPATPRRPMLRGVVFRGLPLNLHQRGENVVVVELKSVE